MTTTFKISAILRVEKENTPGYAITICDQQIFSQWMWDFLSSLDSWQRDFTNQRLPVSIFYTVCGQKTSKAS